MDKATRSKEKLGAALVEILKNTPLDLISISELCEKAGVGRTAYYHNFKQIDDVLKYVYRKAHKKAFQDKYKDYHYLFSDEHLWDMICFFDENSDLLKVILHWQIIDLIAKYNTDLVLGYVMSYEEVFIRENAYYFTCYTGVTYFNMCGAWLNKGKKESKEEFYQLIKAFEALKVQANGGLGHQPRPRTPFYEL